MPKRKSTKKTKESGGKKAKTEEQSGETQPEEEKKDQAKEEAKEEEPIESDESLRQRFREAKGEPAITEPLTIKFRPSKPHKPVKGLDFPLQLEYYPLQGLVEVSKLILEEAQVPYNLTVWSGDAFDEHRKKTTPFGSVPVLRLSKELFPLTDGVLAQSGAIVRFLAAKFGLDAKSAEDRAAVDMVYELAADLKFYMPSLHSQDKQTPAYQKLARLLKCAEALLEKSGGSIFHGMKVTYGDLAMFHILTHFETSKPNCLVDDFKVPKLSEFREKIAQRPNIEQYLVSGRRIPPTYRDLQLPGWKNRAFDGYEYWFGSESNGEKPAAKEAAKE
jgi:glutathione S-transferase